MQGSGSQMANNCNLIKSVDSNDIVTGSSTVFRHIARNDYFAGLDVEQLERAKLLSEIIRERDCDKTGGTFLSSTGVARIFVGGGTRPTPPSLASVVHTFEDVADSWRSVSTLAVSRVMSGAPERKKEHKKNR